MGNLLCVPRLHGNGDRKKTKQTRRWFTRQSKKPTNVEIGQDSSTSTEPCKEEESIQREKSHEDKDQNSVTKYVSEHKIHVDPVVSSSILLRHFDDDSDAEIELTGDHEDASGEEMEIGSSADELISADNQQPEVVEESDEKGDVLKLVDNCDIETCTDKLGPTVTDSTSTEAALIEKNNKEIEPSKEIKVSDVVQTSLKGVDETNTDLARSSTHSKTSMADISSENEESSKVEPVSADIAISKVDKTPDKSANIAKQMDIASSVDIVTAENKVDIVTPEKTYEAEDVSIQNDFVPNRKEKSIYFSENSKVETTKDDVHKSCTKPETTIGRDVNPEEICYSNAIQAEQAKEAKTGKRVDTDNGTKANAYETKTPEGTDVNRVSEDKGRSQYAKPNFIVVKPVQTDTEDDSLRLVMNDKRSADLTCENKLKLAMNEINKTATENKVDESRQSSAKCKIPVCNKINHSADATAGIGGGQMKRETTVEISSNKLGIINSKIDDRSLDNKAPCYNDVRASSYGKARKEIVDRTVGNADVLADAIATENNKAKDRQLTTASSCPTIVKKSKPPNKNMKELSKMLEALSILKLPIRRENQKSTQSSIDFSRNVVSPHQDTSISSCVVNNKQSVLSTTAVSRTAASQNVPLYCSSVTNSKFTGMSRGVSTSAVSAQPGSSGSSQLISKPLESRDTISNVTSTQKGLLTSSEVYVKPQTSTELSGTLTPPQSGNSDISGYYKSSHGMQTWLKNSVSEPLPSVTVQESTSSGKDFNRKVSDFEIPKKKPRPPQTPLVLKKPSPHLFGVPGIAKSDLADNNDVKWTQKNVAGPQTEVLWSSKPTSYDVKFPPLPKRLLEREGSIDKLRTSWVIPQVKQIETLKREFGRFPGLKVPEKRRNKYSVDINDPNTVTVKDEENAEDITTLT